jgi:hypothetical protein
MSFSVIAIFSSFLRSIRIISLPQNATKRKSGRAACFCKCAFDFLFLPRSGKFYFCFILRGAQILFFEVSSFITCSGAVLFGFQVWQTFDTYGA